MAAEIITKEDLQLFKSELIHELRELIALPSSKAQGKKWIKSYEVREMLGISPGTLQHMRTNGTIPYTKMGGLVLYDIEDVVKLMEDAKKSAKKPQAMS
ncbi:helix-turn-helix domain-containing protein [Chitinophaga sp. NPDC101104]|uniref:helix-turn-helix domain-containing protein n=1 Tax=Chitinophaga sp. NPDC101104 TaxID=3390561 RepID=UPI003D04754F